MSDYSKLIHNAPSDTEVCHCLGISMDKLEQLKKDILVVHMGSLDCPLADDCEESILDLVQGDANIEDTVLEPINYLSFKHGLYKIVGTLPEREAMVVKMRYYGGAEFKQIGTSLGVSLGRASAICKSGIRTLRRKRYEDIKSLLIDHDMDYHRAYKGGLGSFRNTWTSSTEKVALKHV